MGDGRKLCHHTHTNLLPHRVKNGPESILYCAAISERIDWDIGKT